MVSLTGSAVWWTWQTEDAFRRVRDGDKHALRAHATRLGEQLTQLTGMVRSVIALLVSLGYLLRTYLHPSGQCGWAETFGCPHARSCLTAQVRGELSSEARRKVNTLIITDVHGRDILDTFVRESVTDAQDFAWESQLRFYWERTSVCVCAIIVAEQSVLWACFAQHDAPHSAVQTPTSGPPCHTGGSSHLS